MTRQAPATQITAFDHMILSAGGRTDAEFETAMMGKAPTLQCRLCAAAADVLYRIVLRLEARANRSLDRSHHRMV